MAIIEIATGECRIADGRFDNFNWPPTWTGDGSWVVFGAPFQPRRLFGVRPDEMRLHEWKFPGQPPMPMLDVTGMVGFLAS